MGRGGTSLGHETSEVCVEDSHIFYRCHDSDVSIRSDNDDRTIVTETESWVAPSLGHVLVSERTVKRTAQLTDCHPVGNVDGTREDMLNFRHSV